jgi:hypothetical protein
MQVKNIIFRSKFKNLVIKLGFGNIFEIFENGVFGVLIIKFIWEPMLGKSKKLGKILLLISSKKKPIKAFKSNRKY